MIMSLVTFSSPIGGQNINLFYLLPLLFTKKVCVCVCVSALFKVTHSRTSGKK